MGVPGKSLRSRQALSEFLYVPQHRLELAVVDRVFIEQSDKINFKVNPQLRLLYELTADRSPVL